MTHARARRGLALAAALGIVAFAVHLAGGRGARADTGAGQGVTPQPVLGTADQSTVLMGAATAGAPGEAWAYKVLPLDVSPPADTAGRDAFAPALASDASQGQLVFERASDEDADWTIAETPLDEAGQPYRGMQPNRISARIAPHGGGLLVGEDSTRPSGKQVVVLASDPGGRFQVLPEPQAGVLLGAGVGGDPNAEVLAEAGGSGAVADAAVENEGHTEAFFGALGRTQDTAVVRWNGTKFSREPVELPKGYEGSLHDPRACGGLPTEHLDARAGQRAERAWGNAVQAHRNSGRSQVAAGGAWLGAVLRERDARTESLRSGCR